MIAVEHYAQLEHENVFVNIHFFFSQLCLTFTAGFHMPVEGVVLDVVQDVAVVCQEGSKKGSVK